MANETLREGGAAPTLLDPGTGTATRPAAVTRREPGPIPGSSAAATLHENPVPRTPVAGVRVVVPELLRERYQVTRQLPTKGAEADILLAEDAQLQRQVILKLYRPGIVPKTDVLEKLLATAPEHVIQLYDHGQAEGVYYEVMEYAQHGSLRDLIKAPLPPEQALSVLKELHAALTHLHQHQLLHRDIKPENILVRHLWPLDLILTDFGISSINEATHRMTTASRTAQYAPPEAIDGKVSAKSDWWSLGIIMLETLLGKTPFDGMAVQAINSYLRNHPIEFDGVADPRWLTLLHGLLNRNEDVRWGGTEVTRWLAGETVPVVEDVGTRQGNAQQTDSHRPYILAGSPYATPKALAGGLAQHWDEGVKHLTRGLILTWVREEVKDYDLASFMMDLAENRDSPDVRLVKLNQRLDPDLPPIWKGIDASPRGVLALAKAAQNDPQQRLVLSEFLSGGIAAFNQQEIKDLARRHVEARTAYERSWGSRMPVAVKLPQFDVVLPTLVMVTESPKALESLRQHVILNLSEDAKACPWFAKLGKPEEADMATLLVMANAANTAAEWERDRKRTLKAAEEQEVREKQTARQDFADALDQLNKLFAVKRGPFSWPAGFAEFFLRALIMSIGMYAFARFKDGELVQDIGHLYVFGVFSLIIPIMFFVAYRVYLKVGVTPHANSEGILQGGHALFWGEYNSILYNAAYWEKTTYKDVALLCIYDKINQKPIITLSDEYFSRSLEDIKLAIEKAHAAWQRNTKPS